MRGCSTLAVKVRRTSADSASTLVALGLDAHLPLVLLLPLAIAGAAAFGAAWAFIPAWLQARRGSHIVITTIMFNFIASALMVYLLVNVLIRPGSMTPETRMLADGAWLPFMHEILALVGIEAPSSPLNLTFFWALICCVAVWIYVWKTRWGFELRTVGANEAAAVYAGISPARVIVVTMCISGALAGFVAVNEVLGVHHRLFLDFTAGYGFTGIAVALMGRNHPLGIVIAAVLFGVLYQGGAELAFEIPSITREMVVVMQGLVILFCGALEYMVRPLLLRWSRACWADPSRERAGVSEMFLLVVLTLDATARLAAPLVLAALAGLFAERSGVIDIGLEGKMLAAAFASAAVAAVSGSAWSGCSAPSGYPSRWRRCTALPASPAGGRRWSAGSRSTSSCPASPSRWVSPGSIRAARPRRWAPTAGSRRSCGPVPKHCVQCRYWAPSMPS